MPVHCAEQAETVREYCGRSRGGFKPKREVLLKFVVQLKIICVDAISEPWLLILVGNVADFESSWLAHLFLNCPPPLRVLPAYPPDAQLPMEAVISTIVDSIVTSAEPLYHKTRDFEEASAPPPPLEEHRRNHCHL